MYKKCSEPKKLRENYKTNNSESQRICVNIYNIIFYDNKKW